jgi:hypothetical protein
MMSLIRCLPLAAFAALVGMTAVSAGTDPAKEAPKRQLAVVLAGDCPGAQADAEAVRAALLKRGFSEDEIIYRQGPATSREVRKALLEARRRVAGWSDGEVFFAYSGNAGYVSKPTVRAGMELADKEVVLWDEVFETLALPGKVHLTLLADCCHTNLLAGKLPANVSALIQGTKWGQSPACIANIHNFGREGTRGVISYYAARALEQATTMADWLRLTVALCDADVERGVLPERYRLELTVAGDGDRLLAGKPVKR